LIVGILGGNADAFGIPSGYIHNDLIYPLFAEIDKLIGLLQSSAVVITQRDRAKQLPETQQKCGFELFPYLDVPPSFAGDDPRVKLPHTRSGKNPVCSYCRTSRNA
jgi:hypothetical protein